MAGKIASHRRQEHSVTHHRKKHHAKKHHHKPSKLSLFKHKIADMFSEIVEAPPEEPKHEEVQTEVVQDVPEIVQKGEPAKAEKSENITQEPVPPKIIPEDSPPKIEKVDEDKLREKEHEEPNEAMHNEVLQRLNQAVTKWKETGDVGIHLEAPVSMREKVKGFFSRFKRKKSDVAEKMERHAEEVADAVSVRLKKAEKSGQKVNTSKVISDEWKTVLQRMEKTSSPSEREEIEKIYKELSRK